VRHAIIGAGYGGSVHLPAFNEMAGMEVVAVADGGSGRAKQFSRPGLAAYSDWRRMLEDLKPDSISVAVPPAAQREIVASAIGRGIHVLCEKPLGMCLEDAKDLLRMAEVATVTVAMCFQYRFEPGMCALRQQILSGRLGRLRRINLSWITDGRADQARPWSWQHDSNLGGGVINSFLPHAADLVRWLSGRDALSVTARSAALISCRTDEKGVERNVTAEDEVEALIELSGDAVASIYITNCQWGSDGMHIDILGENGAFRFVHRPPFSGDVELKFFGQKGDMVPIDVPRPVAGEGDSRATSLRQLANLFVAAIGGPNPPDLPSFRDGEYNQRFLTAVRRSTVAREFVTV
jgi:predicted dehydrogenase